MDIFNPLSLGDPEFFRKLNAAKPEMFNQEQMQKNIEDEIAAEMTPGPVLFNGKDIRTVYPISTFSGTTQDELVELIRQVQVEVQDENI